MHRRPTRVAAKLWCSAALAAYCGGSGCIEAPATPPPPAIVAIEPDPARFDRGRALEHIRELVALGPRLPGSPALADARRWAANFESSAPTAPGEKKLVLMAPLVTTSDAADLEAESAGAAVAAEAVRALAASGVQAVLALEDDLTAPFDAEVAGAPLVIVVRRGCGVPQRRDLFSHRVLRERFYRISGSDGDPRAFEQVDAGQAALLAAGAVRVLALDPPAQATGCDPGELGSALMAFVRDAQSLLDRQRAPRFGGDKPQALNSVANATSYAGPEAPSAPQRSSP